ncbi:hypothetical protein EYC84_009248 [Monilinia fructicola]|uniref:Uncharacterized protein n=1 Tax=Monilinia fructicola TaxID=38448 RepID=A0A5M9JHV9_MONFR|nr:hypothetical protein EYC84_009248 [Monilinia fructicola]
MVETPRCEATRLTGQFTIHFMTLLGTCLRAMIYLLAYVLHIFICHPPSRSDRSPSTSNFRAGRERKSKPGMGLDMKARVCKRVYWPLHFDILSKEKKKEMEGKGWEWANERNNTILQARHGYGYGNERTDGGMDT